MPPIKTGFFFLFLICGLNGGAFAMQPPKPGDALGGIEYSFLSPVSKGSNTFFYSEALRFGFSSLQFIPFNSSFEFGFLNSQRQRYTQLNLFNFGLQPSIPKSESLSFYFRAEVLSLGWSEGGHFSYRPGFELGLVVPFSEDQGLLIFSKASLDGKTKNGEKRWGEEDGAEHIFWLGLSWLQVNRQPTSAAL